MRISVLMLALLIPTVVADSDRVHVSEASDARAIEIAQKTVATMGGWDALDATRFVSFKFFGSRQHYWDRYTGDSRIESERDGVTTLMLFNANTKEGRVFRNGEELTGDALAEALDGAHQAWINDTYWMFMPYKLLDAGVTLKFAGERASAEGADCWVLDLTFEEVGYTPQNRYHVYVGKESGLVEQWDFFSEAGNADPNFAMPWKGWKKFGRIHLATDHGRGRDWQIAVHDSLPASVFNDPAPVKLD